MSTCWLLHLIEGPGERLEQAFEEVWRHPRDRFADCSVCEENFQVKVLLSLRRVEEAIEHAEQLFSSGRSCAEVPHATYPPIALELFEAGELDRARACAERGLEMCRHNPDFLREMSYIIDFDLRDGRLDRAVSLFEDVAPWYVDSWMPAEHMAFAEAAEHLARAWMRERDGMLPLRIPKAFELFDAEHRYDPEVLASHFGGVVDGFAAQFDARNGNTYVSDELARRRHHRKLD